MIGKAAHPRSTVRSGASRSVVRRATRGAASMTALLLGTAHSAVAQHSAPIDWPARLPTAEGRPGVTHDPGFEPGSFLLVRVSERSAPSPTAADRADAAALLTALGLPDTTPWEAESSGAMVARPFGAARPRDAFDPERYAVFISGTRAAPDAPVHIQRTWFGLYTPLGGPGGLDGEGEPALALLIPGMFGTPEPIVEQFVLGLRQRGWHVLLMVCQPSRFTERRSVRIDPGAPAADQMGPIATLIDDRFAECAYAVESAASHFAALLPELPARRVAVGFSAGALAMPAVLAREPAAYRAALLIGPGADMFTMALTSNYADWIDAVRVEWAGPVPSGPSLEPFSAAYREASRLDPWALAPRLTELPVFLVLGERDRAVPAELGMLLWERWGRPERRVLAMGHEVLFFGHARARAGELLGWLDDHAE